jgi:hypothetical protein
MNAITPGLVFPTPISRLPPAQALDGTELTLVVQNGISCRTPVAAIPGTGGGSTGTLAVQTLTYVAAAGQTAFPLWTADKFGKTATLSSAKPTEVFSGGLRLALDDGTGYGGFTLDYAGNRVLLTHPAGQGTIVQVSIYGAATLGSGGGGTAIGGSTEAVTVTAPNELAPLAHAPDGSILVLFVDGKPFFAVGLNAAFTFKGSQLTWTSTVYTIATTSDVVCVYTHL